MLQGAKNVYHLGQAVIASTVNGFPAKKMRIIGVTGTDGKTTTASLIYHILQEAGYKAALLTTVSALIDGKTYDTGFHVTTPDSFALQSYLKKAREAGVEIFVLEVTSHGLDQNRVWGIPFEIGVVTNITHEHLDYHKTYKRYVAAKAKLLKSAKIPILNRDDDSYPHLLAHLHNSFMITYGRGESAHLNPENFPFTTKLLGDFNVYNCLAAIAATRQIGVPDATIRKAIASFTPPVGRQDIVYDKDFRVIIDFAHTPNSFLSILPEVRKLKPKHLIHVFGAAGKRDESKRPLMGKAASDWDDIIVLTSEDPRGEPIEKIFSDIHKGISKGFTYRDYTKFSGKLDQEKIVFRIPDRQEAIQFAIQIAGRGDTVITTGKSHEKSMNYGQGEVAWDEYAAVKEAIKHKEKGA